MALIRLGPVNFCQDISLHMCYKSSIVQQNRKCTSIIYKYRTEYLKGKKKGLCLCFSSFRGVQWGRGQSSVHDTLVLLLQH